MALDIKRTNEYLKIWLAAETVEEVEVFNKLGKEYNRLYNKYLNMPVVAAKDNKMLSRIAVMAAQQAVVRVPLPEYAENEQYLGNLPLLTLSWAGHEEKRQFVKIPGIGSFRLIEGSAGISTLEKIHSAHRRRNKHLPPTPYTLDPICTKSICLASAKSFGFDIAPSGADHCLHIHY